MEPQPLNDKPRPEVAPSQSWPGVMPWVTLGFWFIVQFSMFYQYLHREILWAFPGHWDQVRYFQESLSIYRDFVTAGLPRGLMHALLTPTPTGNLLCIEAAVLYLFWGPSRFTALLVLFLHWVLFQAIALAVIRWLSRRWSVAVIGLALLLVVASQFRREGSLATFQIDFATFCTFGILICLAIRSNFFANRGSSVLLALVASYLVLLRFITLTYLGSIGAIFLIVAGIIRLFRKQAVGNRLATRFTNVLLIGGIILAICLPFFWHNRQMIYVYYVVNHVTGPEKYVRIKEFGINTKLDSILYYPRYVWSQHTGTDFQWIGGVLILLSFVIITLRKKFNPTASRSPSSAPIDIPLAYLFLSICLVGPYLMLTADVVKTPVHGYIFVPPLWALIMMGVAYSSQLSVGVRWCQYAWTGLAILLSSVAFSYQVSSYNQPGRFANQRANVQQVLALHDLIGQKCVELGLKQPAIGTDRLDDSFFPSLIGVTQWERHQILLLPRNAYPQTVVAADEEETMAGLRSADFVLLTLSEPSTASPYDFDHTMRAMDPKLFAFCDAEMLPLQETSLFGRRARLYMRPSLRMESRYGDWISDDGLTLHGTVDLLRRFSDVTLQGATFPSFHLADNGGNVTATLEMQDRSALSVTATFTETNGQYTIHLSVPPLDGIAGNEAIIRVQFNRFFVPQQIGLNNDTRHLVVRVPDSVHLGRYLLNQ